MTGQNPGKTAAIILGGIAGVAFLVIFLLFARSLRKKHSGMSYMLQELFIYEVLSLCFILSCFDSYLLSLKFHCILHRLLTEEAENDF